MFKRVWIDGLEHASKFKNVNFTLEPEESVAEDSTSPGDWLADGEDLVINHTYHEYVEKMISINRKPFSFEGREYLIPIYDGFSGVHTRRTILVAGRQVEKSLEENEPILLSNGTQVPIKDVQVGDLVVTMSPDDVNMTTGRVTWTSRRYQKNCIRIRTRQGHSIVLATTHPLRVWQAWKVAKKISVGDRIAVVRKAGTFTGSAKIQPDLVSFAAFMLGDGSCGGERGTQFGFTQSKETPQLVEFLSIAERKGWSYRLNAKTNKRESEFAAFSRAEGTFPRKHLESWDLWGKASETKSFPWWVWDLDENLTALFLNRLWSTDGCVSESRNGRINIEYSSISRDLVYSVQRLLWKFGIPSKIRSYVPKVYEGTDKKAFILRVETQEGLRRFLLRIGALGKSEGVTLPDKDENNNRDTYPKELNEIIHLASGQRNNHSVNSLHKHKLRFTPKYSLTKRKLQQYVDVLRADAEADQDAVDLLEQHLFTDIFWDVITEIEPVGRLWCRDISVEGGESFVTDGIISHNSSSLSALTLVRMAVRAFSSVLIVEPRIEQVRVFSHQRLRLMAEDSPILARAWLGGDCQWQVGVREMKNRSIAYLRSCYYSADPLRGITASDVYIDELQDIISDNIPVIEECQSHYLPEDRLNTYAGTPNTTSNTLSIEYQNSCQFEWMPHCDACGNWNYLDEKVIGKKSYICAKCGRPIFMKAGRWVPMRPSMMDEKLGYRIPQIMVPFMTHAEVLRKREDPNRPLRMFYNEVLGLPYDAGQLILTEADIKSACEESRPSDTPITVTQRGIIHLCAGLDHGTGGYTPLGMGSGRSIARIRSATKTSFTVLAHGGFCRDGKFRIVNIMKFVGELSNLAHQPSVINEVARGWNTRWVMSDAGFGGQTNSRLVDEYGWSRIDAPGNPMLMECEYVYTRKLASFDPGAFRYVVDRNYVIELFVNAIKRGEVLFFRQSDMEEFISDFTSIFAEYSSATNRIRYDHNRPDDCFHACLYCYLAALQRAGRFILSSGW